MQNNQESKPARLAKIEAYHKDKGGEYVDFRLWQDRWGVVLDGRFEDQEVNEIAKALRAVNKAGRL